MPEKNNKPYNHALGSRINRLIIFQKGSKALPYLLLVAQAVSRSTASLVVRINQGCLKHIVFLGPELLAAGSTKSLIQETVRNHSRFSFQPSLRILRIVGLISFFGKKNTIQL